MFATKSINMDFLLRVTLIIALIYWSFLLIGPVLLILTWGGILAVTFAPLHGWLSNFLGGRPTLSAIILSVINLLLIVGSVVLLTNNVILTVSHFIQNPHENLIPQPPSNIKNWPILGTQLYDTWSMASSNIESLFDTYSKPLISTGKYLLSKSAGISIELLQFIGGLIFSCYLLSNSTKLSTVFNKFMARVAPERSSTMVKIIKDTIQNIASGVVGASLLQAIILGIVLLAAGIHGAGLMSFLALILGVTQIGLFVLVIPIAIWLFLSKSLIAAIAISLPLLAVAIMDNLFKPYLLAKGLHTPMLIILIGLIGGILMHGLIGMFLGPVVLAILYDVTCQWLKNDN